MKFELIDADDWQGLYVDGELVAEGHKISLADLANVAALTFTKREALPQGADYLYDHGNFPDRLEDFEQFEQAYVPYSEAQEDVDNP